MLLNDVISMKLTEVTCNYHENIQFRSRVPPEWEQRWRQGDLPDNVVEAVRPQCSDLVGEGVADDVTKHLSSVLGVLQGSAHRTSLNCGKTTRSIELTVLRFSSVQLSGV